MLVRLSYLWEKVTSSYWFIPTLMLGGSAVLSVVMLEIDYRVGQSLAKQIDWVHAVGPAGARALLSVVASSMITVAGVVFSITIVVLTLASSQYGPRVLRNFFRDITTSAVFGTFLATFLYCLLVLRVIDDDDGTRVPYGAVSVAVGFALASLLVLIYFIHHISTSIQASAIVEGAYNELLPSIDRTFPARAGENAPTASSNSAPESAAHVRSFKTIHSGYILRIDDAGVLKIATEHDARVEIVERPGGFVVEGATLATVHSKEEVDDEVLEDLAQLFIIGPERTPHQDVLFAFRQLVEIAVRSLSPGVNDPFTALLCIDYLGAALCKAAERDAPPSHRHDENGILRLKAEPIRFGELADAAWDEIRHYGAADPQVSTHLMDSMKTVAKRVVSEESLKVVRDQAGHLMEDCRDKLIAAHKLAALEESFVQLQGATVSA